MSLFNVNIRDWIIQQLNPLQRDKKPLIDLLESYLVAVQEKYNELDAVTDQNIIRAKASGQPIKMRKALEDLTGITGITVTINRNIIINELFLPSESLRFIGLPSEDTLAFRLFLPLETDSGFPFTIGIPAASYNTDVAERVKKEIQFFGTATQDFNVTSI